MNKRIIECKFLTTSTPWEYSYESGKYVIKTKSGFYIGVVESKLSAQLLIDSVNNYEKLLDDYNKIDSKLEYYKKLLAKYSQSKNNSDWHYVSDCAPIILVHDYCSKLLELSDGNSTVLGYYTKDRVYIPYDSTITSLYTIDKVVKWRYYEEAIDYDY